MSNRIVVVGGTQDRVVVREPYQTGPPGPPGPMGTLASYTHVQETPATVWTIDHNLGQDPLAIQVFVEGLHTSEFEVTFTIANKQVRLGFDIAVTGVARMR